MAINKTLVITIISILFAHQSAYGANTAYETFREGLNLEQSLKHFEAGEKFRKAIAAEPENEGYLEHYAWFLSADGFSDEAAAAFRVALPASKNQENIQKGLGWNEKLTGRFEESINAYGKAFHVDYSTKTLQDSFKDISARLKVENATNIKNLLAELAKDPDNKGVSMALFDAYISQGESKSAITVGTKLAAEYPNDLQFRLKLALAHFWAGEKETAESALKDLLVSSPENAFLYYQLGKVQRSQGKKMEARATLERSLTLYPNAAVTKKELAEILAESGKGEEARSLAASIKDNNGESLTAQLAVARVLHFSGNIQEASSCYKKILRNYPYNNEALWGLVETSILTGRTDTAERALNLWQQNWADPRIEKQKELLKFETSPRLGLLGEYYENSAGFTRYNIGTALRSIYNGTTFDIGYNFSAFDQNGFSSITRNSVSLGLERRITDTVRGDGSISGNFYDNDQNHLNGKASIYIEPTSKFSLALNYEHVDIIDTEPVFKNAIYNYVVTIGSVGSKIATNDMSVYARGSVCPRLDLWGKILYGFLSDGNTKTSYIAGADYNISQTPNLVLGYNYFYLDYRKSAENYQMGTEIITSYYDPTNFEVHTLKLAYNHDFDTGYSLGAEGSLSYIPKSEGVANSLFAYVAYKLGERHLLRLDARAFYQNKGVDRDGQNNGGYFRAENVVLSYEYVF